MAELPADASKKLEEPAKVPNDTPVPNAVEQPDENVIQARTLYSSSLGDLRRNSFIVSAAVRALDTYGISTTSLFTGGTSFYSDSRFIF